MLKQSLKHALFAFLLALAGAVSAAVTAQSSNSIVLEVLRGDLVRTFLEKRVFSPNYLIGREDAAHPVICPFTEQEVPNGWDMRFVVRPHNAFGVAGRPIATPWEYRLWGKTGKQVRAEFDKAHPRW